MERPGLCAICGRPADPAHTCMLCGAIVCSEHFDREKSVCTRCLSMPGRSAMK